MSGTDVARLRLIRCTPDLRSHQLDRLDEWKKALGTALAERLGTGGEAIRVEALVAAALGAFDAALTRWSESDGAEDLIALIDDAFAAVADPFPRLGEAGVARGGVVGRERGDHRLADAIVEALHVGVLRVPGPGAARDAAFDHAL